jgi:hypothetical protein
MKRKPVKPMTEAKVAKIINHSSRIITQAQHELATDFDTPAGTIINYYSNVMGIKPEHFAQVTAAYNQMIDRAFDQIADAIIAKERPAPLV